MTIKLSISFAHTRNLKNQVLDRTREKNRRSNLCVTGTLAFLDILKFLSHGGGVNSFETIE